jgi:hypothetical protein
MAAKVCLASRPYALVVHCFDALKIQKVDNQLNNYLLNTIGFDAPILLKS